MPAPRKAATQPRSNGTAKRLPAKPKPAKMVEHDGLQVPELVGEFLDESKQMWTALWLEPQAAHLTGAQKVVALRYIEAFDAWRRALEAVKREPTVAGSMGQPVANPLISWVTGREAEMEKCERQLGIGLRNKADLGLTVGQAKLTAAQLNQMVRGNGGSNSDTPAIEVASQEEDGWTE